MAKLSRGLREKILRTASAYRHFNNPIEYAKEYGEELHLLYVLIEILKDDIATDVREATERKASKLFLT